MKGFREIGKTKAMQINTLNKHLEKLGKLGINGLAYLSKRYGVSRQASSFVSVSTKQLSGMISDLNSLYPKRLEELK